MKDVKNRRWVRSQSVPRSEVIGSMLAFLGLFFLLMWGAPIAAEVIKLGW